MATTSNTYTGNGSNRLFTITFPYLDTTDIDVYLNGTLQTVTTQYTFANATTVEFVTAPSNGATVLLNRSTNDTTLAATFFSGSSIRASDLNENFDQVLYLAQETNNNVANAVAGQIPDGTITNAKINNTAGIDASKLSFTQSGTGATARTINSKLNELVSVKDFGAIGDGITDDTAAFSAAAAAAFSVLVQEASVNTAGIPTASTAQVYVPDGLYLLNTDVNIANKNLVWQFSQGATIKNGLYSKCGGTVNRIGSRVNSQTTGVRDDACGLGVQINHPDFEAAIAGFYTPAQLGTYAPRDAAALFTYARPHAAVIDSSSTTYGLTSVTFGGGVTFDATKLKVGMIIDVIDTSFSGSKVSGFVTGWNAGTKTINVNAWYNVTSAGIPAASLVTGQLYTIDFTGTTNWTSIGASSSAVGTEFTKNATAGTGTGSAVRRVTPVNGTRALVNVCTSVWSMNPVVELGTTDYADVGVGLEVDIYNNKALAAGAGSAPILWGIHTVSTGLYKGDAAFVADGGTSGLWRGYLAQKCDIGYQNKSDSAIFQSTTQTGNYQNFVVDSSGNIELGLKGNGVQNNTYIDFHSGPYDNDYDGRILCQFGDSGLSGQGRITITVKELIHSGNVFYPINDVNQDLGASNKRWTRVFGAQLRPGDGSVTWTSGAGSPNGVSTAAVGSLYTRTDGGANTTLYIKESGTGNTGWVAK